MSWNGPAVCFSVDDVHPAPVAAENLAHVRWLQERHPHLRVTFFTTPDWRTLDPYPTKPFVSDDQFTVETYPSGTFQLDRHQEFCSLLRDWDRGELALHGFQHVRSGMTPVLEFERRSTDECRAILRQAAAIFREAKLPCAPGMSPPGWSAPPPLLEAMKAEGFRFVASARDLDTAISTKAVANGSGLRGISLVHPQRIEPGLLHIPTNFQATSALDRALAILDCGGLLSIKAHLLETSGSYRALDGLTIAYREQLHRLFTMLEERFDDELTWTSMGEIAA